MNDVTIRPYDPVADRDALWSLKREFELGLGSETGGTEKGERYEGKLTDDYRDGYLDWVVQSMAEEPTCVSVAVADGELVGYAFVLPDSLSYIWDAAVLNELYVVEPYRGRGVADELLEAVLGVAREQDLPLDRLVLDVDRSNARARQFYRRHGFDHWGEMLARSL